MRFHAVAVSGERSEVFVGPDQNTCKIKRELALKAAKHYVERQVPGKLLFVGNLRGAVSANWRQLVEITPLRLERLEDGLSRALAGDGVTQWFL